MHRAALFLVLQRLVSMSIYTSSSPISLSLTHTPVLALSPLPHPIPHLSAISRNEMSGRRRSLAWQYFLDSSSHEEELLYMAAIIAQEDQERLDAPPLHDSSMPGSLCSSVAGASATTSRVRQPTASTTSTAASRNRRVRRPASASRSPPPRHHGSPARTAVTTSPAPPGHPLSVTALPAGFVARNGEGPEAEHEVEESG